MSKPVVLVFIKRFLPGYKAGGPIRTVANLIARLGMEFDFYIVTLDRDIGDTAPYPCIEAGTWQKVGGARVRYLAKNDASMRRLTGFVREIQPSAIYLNGFLDPVFTQRLLWARRLRMFAHSRLVLAPRGEFSDGALAIKAFKKNSYLAIASICGLYRGLTWQASSEREVNDIRKRFPAARPERILVARNLAPPIELAGSDDDKSPGQVRVSDGRLDVCFLARVVPMKNLDFALKVLKVVDVPIRFTIYGPKEDAGYWQECLLQSKSLPAHVSMDYVGPVAPEDVRQRLSRHDVFFLPTRGENYGHVIFEALAAGLPVLISDRTPWSGIQAADVGWAFSLDDVQPFVDVLNGLVNWTSDQWDDLEKRARAYAADVADDASVLENNRNLFISGSLQVRLL